MYHTSSRSTGQRSRSQHNVTGAKISEIFYTIDGDCSTSLTFCTDAD